MKQGGSAPRAGRHGRSLRLPVETHRRLYRDLVRIRKVELKIEELYPRDEMKTPVHLCIGQEAVAVGVCAALEREDYVSSNHRGHGHYLAKGGNLRAMLAELYGRETGCSKGRGGSMHLVDLGAGLVGSSSIVGGGIPIATGLALASVLRKRAHVSVAFFGDGAADEGVLYESVNFAILKKLPVLFVLENNEYSVCSRVGARQARPVVFLDLKGSSFFHRRVDGNDVLAVHAAARAAVTRARKGGGPSFLECKTYRMRGHAGGGSDAHLGYRSEAEIRKWEERCPLRRYKRALLRDRMLDEAALEAIEQAVDREIEEAFEAVRGDPYPSSSELARFVYQ